MWGFRGLNNSPVRGEKAGGRQSLPAGGELDARGGTATLGFVNVVKDLPEDTGKGGTLYVFALPQERAQTGGAE